MFKLIETSELSGGEQIVDVRTPSEFATGHIAQAVNVPLDQIESRIQDVDPGPIVLVCKGGTRAKIAANLIAPCRSDVAVLAGGMDAWYRAGNSVVVNAKTRWSLERQVRFGAGVLVLAGVVASLTVHPRFVFLSAFVGAGLTFAGLTDFCAMGELLARMPWNRGSKLSAIRNGNGTVCTVKD
ncbi:Rhodanese/sulfurtransferase-like protein [Candidatus Koribacter versatilis Ellin345]|uniref:Rhodanese/sulfurtransferase-like protein n=1 Tax=Koribacter versatilis (strain Ellin345) TaxID=204669 RepID=Q1IM16_KORVE|nr:rhodanese-like domain-containing protein [Candidatus Koribacter versatilis]ABF42084.1 Rhodanese/sulfurtransferase-like protein [Candidatus Koribacter versatilis Ellin345]